jgi:CDP-6-deoxy-D-xylo-4-hexulose-3-dehydrase
MDAVSFTPGITPIPASSPVITEAEIDAMSAVVRRGWLTAGPVNNEFEKKLAQFVGVEYCHTCNSGSSANLLAVASLVECGRLKPGDEVIVPATSFPTTVNPLLLYGLVPVFVDIDQTYNIDFAQACDEVTENRKAKAIMAAHTLGNPFNPYIYKLVDSYGLVLVEDCCDALGATINGEHVGKHGVVGTCSFFPAHHITMGEGGAIWTNDAEISTAIESCRDWGRDCYCEPGKENTCGKRFCQKFGELPEGYDHKYTYTRLGFNLKITEIQSACGLAQIEKLGSFVEARRRNFASLLRGLDSLRSEIVLPNYGKEASPFGFPITLKETGLRAQLQEYLAQYQIGSRLLFAGNIVKQPYMAGRNFRIHGDLKNSDKVMHDGLWIGCWPGLTEEMLEFVCEKIGEFFGKF